MGKIFNNPKVKVDNYGRVITQSKSPEAFQYLVGHNVNDILLFDNGTDELKEDGKVILPRHYHICIGTKDSEVMMKSYEYDQYRIVVTTYKDIIYSIDSLG